MDRKAGVALNAKNKKLDVDFLYQAILQLRTMEECSDFFSDLCTITELKALSQRLEVAKMLSEGCVYSEIVTKTGASTATISRVNRSLHYGKDGYQVVFARMMAEAEAEAGQT